MVKSLQYILSIGLCLAFTGRVNGQEFKVGNPLPITPSLSGNYGELRPNHFHGGLDLKTAGREGIDVLSAADGHVSRIKVSPWGYGKALYIDHPNGYTTVYGHLKAFSPSIETYVLDYQRRQQSFEIDLYPGEADLPVKKDEVVALSGNTGGSGGPHLHFEVRETKSEVPRNPLLFDFPVSDSKPPVIEAVGISPLGNGSKVNNSTSTVHARVSGSSIAISQPVQVDGVFGVEVNGYDGQDGSYNHNGIYQVDLIVDGALISRFTADSISFALSRHLNSLIDYPYYYKSRQRFMRLYRLPGNQLENLAYKNDGYLDLAPGEHDVAVSARDQSGNETNIQFSVRVKTVEVAKEEEKDKEIFEWDLPHLYESADVQLYFPVHTIYATEPLKIEEGRFGERPYVEVMDPWIPVQEAFDIRMRIPEGMDREGLLIAQSNSSGRPSRALESSEDGDWMRAQSRNFGIFTLVNDTKAPSILPGNFRSGITWSQGQLRFEVKDDLSGIQSYSSFVDGEWVLMEFEPKQDLMFIHVKDLPQRSEIQDLRIEVSDMAGNVATFEGTLMHP